jgi:hypothetical protein
MGGSVAVVILFTFSPSLGAGPKGTVYNFVVPKQGGMIGDARYYCWIPASVSTLRCVLVHQHGCTTEGSAPPMVNDVQWLSLAKKWNSVFVSPMLVTGPNGTPDCNNWFNINNGSGNCFIAMLDTLARRSGHAEIKTIPWALWGHSGGAMWSVAMTGKYPERIAATVAQACGTDISNVPAALKVPVLHCNGKQDICHNDTYFANGRSKGAFWAHAINPNTTSDGEGHMVHDVRLISIRWFDYCLALRLPDVSGESQLKAMDTSNAWLGDKTALTVASAATYTGNKLAACWFPNRTMAEKWLEYVKTGTIKDSTAGPAPYNLTGTLASTRFTIKWDCDADLEGGIKTFKIYRNDALYRTLKYTVTSTYSSIPGFQRWNECDQPNPSPAPEMTFTDSTVTSTGTYTYQLSLINWFDFEGAKSDPITLKGGQVTMVAVTALADGALHRSTLTRWNVSSGKIDLSSGIVNIFDIRGCLLKTVTLKNSCLIDIRALLGGSVGKVVIVKNIVK